VIVCVEGRAEDRRIDRLTRRLARQLVHSTRVVAAEAGFDSAEAGPDFLALAPENQFPKTLDQLTQARQFSEARNANEVLALSLYQLAGQQEQSEALDELDKLCQPYLAALEGGEPNFNFLDPTQPRWQPLVNVSGSGRIRFVRVQFADDDSGIDVRSENIAWLRRQVDRMAASSNIEDLDYGVTGIPAIEADETAQSIKDASLASLVAIGLITGLMLLVYRGVRIPLLAAGSLLIGMAWSFGWLTLAVGHLQLLSVVFSVILLGLGIDFALHLVSRLELVGREHADLPSAVSRVFRGIGPGMVTGALTVAAAFFATALTDFRGMAEMGIIAGGGILLCLIAMLSAFPASLSMTGQWKRIVRQRPGGETAHFARGWLDPIHRHPVRALVVCGLVLIGFLAMAPRVRYDPNVLNLQPTGIESVAWEMRLAEEDERSVWAALLVASPDTAEELVTRLRAVDLVADVGGMGMLYPADLSQRLAQLAQVRHGPVNMVSADPGVPDLLTRLSAVRSGLMLRARQLGDDPRTQAHLMALAKRLGAAVAGAQAMTSEAEAASWRTLDRAFLAARHRLRGWLNRVTRARQPGAEDLPPELREHWIGTDGSWLLMVFPAADAEGRSILHPDRLGTFVSAVRGAVPNGHEAVIGPPVQIYESSELIKLEYLKAAIYAVLAVFVLLVLDFRSLPDALCAMVPVVMGFVGVFGMLGGLGQQLNFANIIVLPIIFGIGAGTGVHVVHRWRAEPHGEPAGLSGGTGRAITLTMLTTMMGFGCMLLAQHRGIRSLGFVMVIGLGVTLLACYTALPAILRLRRVPAELPPHVPQPAVPGSVEEPKAPQAQPQPVGASTADPDQP
jgi:predicted exporter